MRKWRLSLVATAIVLMLAGVGCSGGDGGAKVATLGDGDGGSDASDASDGGGGDGQASEEDFQDAMLEFAQCMREHGVDMPDPTFDGEGRGGMVITRNGANEDPQVFEDAQAACGPIMEDARQNMPKPSPEEQAEMQDKMLEFAQCMRDHGIDMPDPTFDGEGKVTMGVGGPPGEGDAGDATDAGTDAPSGGAGPRMDPEFEAAMEECSPEGGPFGMAVDSSDSPDDADDSDDSDG